MDRRMLGYVDASSATVHRNFHVGGSTLALVASAGRRAITWSAGANSAGKRISISHAKRGVAKYFDCKSLGKRGRTTLEPSVTARDHATQYL